MSTKINAYLYFSKFLATFLDDDSNQIGTETLPLDPPLTIRNKTIDKTDARNQRKTVSSTFMWRIPWTD